MPANKTEKKIELLLTELGCDNVVEALQFALYMRSALRVIHTWATVPKGLDPDHVMRLADEALMGDGE